MPELELREQARLEPAGTEEIIVPCLGLLLELDLHEREERLAEKLAERDRLRPAWLAALDLVDHLALFIARQIFVCHLGRPAIAIAGDHELCPPDFAALV